MATLLITGFDSFGDHAVNPSWEAVSQLPEQIGKYRLHRLQLPTVYGKAAQLVLDAAENIHADAIICVGLAAGRDAITPERIAVNIRDARIPDNAGVVYSGQKIAEDGPAAYFSTLPVEKMVQAIRDTGIPAAVSNSAGTFVCNDTLYTLLHRFGETGKGVCFIHVPNLLRENGSGLPLETIVAGLTAAISVLE